MPCQRIHFLGFLIDSVAMTLSLPEEKLSRIEQDCREAMSQSQITVRDLARMIGRMTAATQAILPAPLHFRALQFLKNEVFQRHQSFEAMTHLNEEAEKDLTWWMEMRRWNGRPLTAAPPRHDDRNRCLTARMGGIGRGCVHWGPVVATGEAEPHQPPGAPGGCLRTEELHKRKVGFACQTEDGQHDRHNHMGGTRSRGLCQCTRELWLWCLEKGITLSAKHWPMSRWTGNQYRLTVHQSGSSTQVCSGQ